MELARVLRELSKRPRLLALGALVAAIAAVLSIYSFSGGKLKARSLQYSSASTQVIVDSKASILGNVSQPFEPLAQRAWVYANFMTSPAFLDTVGKQVGLSGAQIYAEGPVNVNEPRVEQEPTDLRRNVELTGETKPYKLGFEAQQNLPTITINAQAPTSTLAVALANAASSSLQQYAASSEAEDGIPAHARIVIRQLGPATGGVVDGGISKTLAMIVFVVVFLLWCVALLVGGRFREAWRQSASAAAAAPVGGDEDDDGAGTIAVAPDDDDVSGGSREVLLRPARGHDPEPARFDAPTPRESDRRELDRDRIAAVRAPSVR